MQSAEVPEVDREDDHSESRRPRKSRVVVVDVVLARRIEGGRERWQHDVDTSVLGVGDQTDVVLQRRLRRLKNGDQIRTRLIDDDFDELAHLLRRRTGLADQENAAEAIPALEVDVVPDRGLVESAEVGLDGRGDTSGHPAQVLSRPVSGVTHCVLHRVAFPVQDEPTTDQGLAPSATTAAAGLSVGGKTSRYASGAGQFLNMSAPPLPTIHFRGSQSGW